ncbi:MAG: NAD(P)-dependent oxidoreductase [[Eubacterium] rectale]|nr:NAD(P)-dependent oxidoreductase [Agathobacter rectalis]
MEYKIKKAVITGGSGGVGLALIKKLLAEKIEILVFQRSESERKKYLPNDPRLKVEFYSLDELSGYVPMEKDYDVFFHLGWTNTQKKYRDDLKKQEENVSYSCDAVELAARMGCHTFIGAGSQAEYGRVSVPLRGDLLCQPETAYGIMKLSACYATRFLCNKYNMRHIWLRILSGYGIYDNVNSMLISNIIKSINKQDLAFSKGEQIWDFIHMDDIAGAMYAVSQRGTANAIYPIGSGEAKPLYEYIKIMCGILGEDWKKSIGKVSYSENQVMYLSADISELTRDTGWKPQIAFEDGIRQVIEFYRTWRDDQ